MTLHTAVSPLRGLAAQPMSRAAVIISGAPPAAIHSDKDDEAAKAQQLLVLVVLVVIALVLLLSDRSLQLAALRKMAEGGKAKTSAFAEAQKYLDGLSGALTPLAIPLGVIGLTGGGVAYMMGNVMAQKILGGVVIGLALTLLAPVLVE